MQVVPPVEQTFEVTYDSAALNVGISVYDTTGSPTLVSGPTAMTSLVGGTYFARYTPTVDKQYVIHKAVYTTAGLTVIDTTYGQGSESILCKETDVAGAVWDALLSSYTTSGSFGAFVQKLLTVAKFLGLK